jgi:hypothetical protein
MESFLFAKTRSFLIVGGLFLATACQKHMQQDKEGDNNLLPSPAPVGSLVRVTVHPEQEGIPVPPAFTGFSYETGILTDSTYMIPSNATLIRLMKNLGKGMLRIGGNSSDVVVWSRSPRHARTGKDSLTSSDIDRFSQFAKALGWPVLFGLNLGIYDTSRAVSEAICVSKSLGPLLAGLQNGNEVEDYVVTGARQLPWEPTNFHREWEQYFGAIRRALPASSFAGPDVSHRAAWISAFGTEEHANVQFLDGHYYRAGPARLPSITYDTLLRWDPGLTTYLNSFVNSGSPYNLPYRITECNSIWDYGKPGVSDVFASALWALDFMYIVLEFQGQGVNFHAGQGYYSPIDKVGQTFVAKPEYYGMLAFHAGAHGRLIPVDNKWGLPVSRAYACLDGKVEYVTLINKEKKKDIAFAIRPGMVATSARVLPLIAPSLAAKDGVSFAGRTVDADGRFVPGQGVCYAPNHGDYLGNFIVNVPAGSAAVVIIK